MDDVITLIKETVTGYDQYGNEQLERTEREVMCQIYGVTRSEFYQAATVDMHPEITARLSEAADYEGEMMAEYDGVLYAIIRTYRDRGSFQHARGGNYERSDPNAIELILERKIGDGQAEKKVHPCDGVGPGTCGCTG